MLPDKSKEYKVQRRAYATANSYFRHFWRFVGAVVAPIVTGMATALLGFNKVGPVAIGATGGLVVYLFFWFAEWFHKWAWVAPAAIEKQRSEEIETLQSRIESSTPQPRIEVLNITAAADKEDYNTYALLATVRVTNLGSSVALSDWKCTRRSSIRPTLNGDSRPSKSRYWKKDDDVIPPSEYLDLVSLAKNGIGRQSIHEGYIAFAELKFAYMYQGCIFEVTCTDANGVPHGGEIETVMSDEERRKYE